MEKTVRINKALADAGVCSRRRADELIAAGRVSVNGEPVASPGLQVTPGTDKLEVDGKPVQPISQAAFIPPGASTFFRKGLSCSPTTVT